MMKNVICSIFFLLLLNGCGGGSKYECESEKGKSLWFDASANMDRFLDKDNVGKYLDKAVETGFTKVIIDVRSGTGYPLYPSEVMPQLSVLKGHEIVRDWDYLGYFLEEAHKRNLKVTASITVFVGGRQQFGEGLVFDDPEKWAGRSSIEYLADRGFVDVRDNTDQSHVFMNPLDPEWRKLTLDLLREIVTNYPVDGIALDYCRYDTHGTTDFSDMSRKAFEEYLGKEIERFPEDIFGYDEAGNRVPGVHFQDWWAFRARNIHDFIKEARDIIKGINPEIELEYWAASWYYGLFGRGQNWGSKRHDASLERPDIANENYKNYGFADLLDIFQSGAYLEKIWGLDEPESIEAQLANTMRIVQGDCKVYGSIYAENQRTFQEMSDAAFVALRDTDGLNVFDIVQVITYDLWDGIKDGIRRYNELEK